MIDRRLIPGPWFFEPDRIEWRTPKGTICLILRNELGSLCGYAAVPYGHPQHGESGEDLECHGGVTYTGRCHGVICHTPLPEDDHDDIWWFGFDCGHAGDLQPFELDEIFGHLRFKAREFNIYRDAAYVKTQVQHLAEQLEEKHHVSD